MDYAIQLFEGKASVENLRYVVAAFARAHKALNLATPKVPDGTKGAAMALPEAA